MSATILLPTLEHLRTAADVLTKNDIVALPTETVYGLAGNVFSEVALNKIFSVKERPRFDPLIVHIPPFQSGITTGGRVSALERLNLVNAAELSELAKKNCEILMERFWPGPLTLVLPKNSKVPDLATSGLPNVAIRMPKHPVAQSVLKLCEFPLAAPSANRFGKISPTSAKAVEQELGDRISLILDGGPSEVGVESSVVQIEKDGRVILLRPGAVSLQMIEQAIGTKVIDSTGKSSDEPSSSPGTSKSHYAPSKPLAILSAKTMDMNVLQLTELLKKMVPGLNKHQIRVGLLTMTGDPDMSAMYFYGLTGSHVTVKPLSRSGNLEEIAKNLFHELRTLDEANIHVILVEPPPSKEGLGHAIWDRLTRASQT